MTSVQTHALQLQLDLSDMDWADGAPCAETDPEAFFVEKGGNPRPAKRVCMRCPVRTQCGEYAIDHDIVWGIWGGLSPKERQAIRRQRRTGQVAA